MDIQQLCKKYGVKPSKSKGQNFLINKGALKKICQAAELKSSDYVLEIGPGFGVLTEELLSVSKKVLSVELDKHLVFYLNSNFKGVKNFKIIHKDILKINNQELTKELGSSQYKIVANLPYSITKSVLRKFLSYEPKPSRMVVLLQKEVAEKIVAKPGKMSLLSLSVQFYGDPKIIDLISKESFYPQPSVTSAILRIDLDCNKWQKLAKNIFNKEEIENFDEKLFWQIIKFGFSSRRKQLQNNLSAGLHKSGPEIKKILKSVNINEQVRAQNLGLKEWLILYQQFVV